MAGPVRAGATEDLPAEIERLRRRVRELEESSATWVPAAEAILNTITEAFITVDCDFRITYINPEATRINRKPREAFLGRTLWGEWPAAVGSQFESQYRLAIAEQRAVHFEERYLAPGYDVWLDVHAYPFQGGLAIHYRDITERKTAEARARELEAELQRRMDDFQALFESTPLGLAVSENAECGFIRVNPALARMLGISKDENASKSGPGADALPYRFFRDGRELRAEELPQQTAQREGRAVQESGLQAVLADGRRLTLYGSAVPLFDESGQVRGSIAGYVDLTERIDAEKKVRESERLYRGIGESIPYGIWICDSEGRNIYASDSYLKLAGITQAQCSDFGWFDTLHPDDRERTIAAWKECVRTRGTWDIEHRFLGTDGKYHPILARGVSIVDDSGNVICWAGINLDISRLKDAEMALERQAEELQRSNRELEEFAHGVSHDLQEPLRTVNAFTQLLLRKVERTGEIQQYAEFIQVGVARMQRLIRDLLAFSRVSHGDVRLAVIDAHGAVDEACHACRQLIDETNAEVEIGELPFVIAEAPPLAQVFQNLISNAIKYRRPDVRPRIRIDSVERPGGWVISVEDNGIGFDPSQSGTVFRMFGRLHQEDYPGTGIGLAICKRIVERFGGRIWAESSPGVGSRFSFELKSPEKPGR